MLRPGLTQLAADLLEANREGDELRVEGLKSQLDEVDPYALDGDDERLAFWINLYNAKVIEEFRVRPRVGHLFRHRKLFDEASFRVGGDEFSLNVIEHGLLRRNSKPPYSFRRVLSSGDRRLEAAPSRLDPRIHFALNCAAASCPRVHAYEPELIIEQLERATRAYFETESSFDLRTGQLTLPYLMKLYSRDFGRGAHELWAAQYLSAEARARVLGDSGPEWNGSLAYGKYDWRIDS